MKLKTAAITVVCVAFGLIGALAQAAPTAISVAPNAGLNCNGNADLDLAWSNLGNVPEFQLGDVTTPAGADLGGFSDTSPRAPLDSYSGPYGIPYNGPIPPGSIIGVYAEVGQRPPLASNTLQFFILVNCSTRQVLFSCFGNYGSCPKTAQGAGAGLVVPTLSQWTLIALGLLVLALGAFALKRRGARI